jgi:hypothetical protein
LLLPASWRAAPAPRSRRRSIQDGRGTGKSFGRESSGSSVAVDELVDAAGTHVGQNKVAIMNKKLDLSLDWDNEQAGLKHEMKSHYRFGGGTIALY